MIESMKVKLIGLVPTIMHNGRLADPDDPFVLRLAPLKKKKPKTSEILEEMAQIECMASLYMNDEGQYIWPGCNVEAMLASATWKKSRISKAECRAIFFCDDFVLTKFDGHKDPEKRVKDPRCRDRRAVVIKKNRVMKVRPIFKNWTAEGSISFNTEFIEQREAEDLLRYCGEIIGLSDFRPKFGRFDVDFE